MGVIFCAKRPHQPYRIALFRPAQNLIGVGIAPNSYAKIVYDLFKRVIDIKVFFVRVCNQSVVSNHVYHINYKISVEIVFVSSS